MAYIAYKSDFIEIGQVTQLSPASLVVQYWVCKPEKFAYDHRLESLTYAQAGVYLADLGCAQHGLQGRLRQTFHSQCPFTGSLLDSQTQYVEEMVILEEISTRMSGKRRDRLVYGRSRLRTWGRQSAAKAEMNPKDAPVTRLALGGREMLKMWRTVASVFSARNDVSGQHTWLH